MAASQSIIVVEHSSLQLEPFPEEGKTFDFALFLDQTWAIGRDRRDRVNKPYVGALGQILVAVDLLLLVGPVRERRRVSPHGNLTWVMNKLELSRETFELLVWFTIFDSDLEEGIVVTLTQGFLHRDGCKLLVGGVVWRCNVVGQKHGVSDHMSEPDDVVISDGYPKFLLAV
jgi:hypothetical protein